MSDLFRPVRTTRRGFLRTSLGAGGALLATTTLLGACTPAPPQPTAAPKAAEPAKPAATSAPAPTTAPAAPAAKAPAPAAAQPTVAAKPAAEPAAGAKPQAIKRGGSLVHSWEFTYPTLDWHLANIANGPALMALYDTLLRYEPVDDNGRHELRPGLAESWERTGDRAFVFKLRKGVKFHDNSDHDAETVKWNLLRVRDHPKSFPKATADPIDTVDVLDTHTVRVNLKRPQAGLLFHLTGATFNAIGAIQSKKAIEALGDDEFGRKPVGTGPFRFKQWITDDRVILERNPDYWDTGDDGKPLPYLDEFVSRFIPDATVALVDLRAGTQQLLDNVPAKDVAPIKGDPNLTYWELSWANQGFFLGGFNVEQGQFTDPRLRKACLHAIDRESLVRALTFGIGKAWYYPHWFEGMMGFDPAITKYEYNPDKVKQYLQEAGKSGGIDTSMLVIAREPEKTIGEAVAQMWTSLGIRTKLEALERLAWIDRMRSKNFEFGFWRYSFPVPEPSVYDGFVKSKSSGNWSQFEDPEVDRLMDAASSTYDEKERDTLYKTVLGYLQDQAYLTTGFMLPATKAYRKEVKDLGIQY